MAFIVGAPATLSQRCKFDMNSLQYKIGSNVYPAQPIRSETDLYAELLKAVGPLGDTRSATRFDLENWTSVVYNSPPTANPSISFVGLDLETYAGKFMPMCREKSPAQVMCCC